MAPHRNKERKAAREDYEGACYTKELGRPSQRKLPKRRLNELTDSGTSAASHGEEAAQENHAPLPREDRAG